MIGTVLCSGSSAYLELYSQWPTSAHFPQPPSLATTVLRSASMHWTILDSICKWDHTLFVFLCLACFMEHNALRVLPYGHKWQDFLLLKVGTAVRCTYTARDFYPLAPRCTPSLFPRHGCLWVVCRECWSPGTAPRSWLQFPWVSTQKRDCWRTYQLQFSFVECFPSASRAVDGDSMPGSRICDPLLRSIGAISSPLHHPLLSVPSCHLPIQ